MANVRMSACLCAICVLSGCTIQQVSPPIQGTVVDAATGAPIKSATVTIGYCTSGYLNPHSERVTQTDSQGRYSFGAKHDLFVWLPMSFEPAFGFSLEAKADGYSTSDIKRYGPWTGVNPPSKIPDLPPGTPRIVYASEVITVDPIALDPASVTGPAQR